MRNLSQQSQRVRIDHFSMQQRADIPRSRFNIEHTHKTAIAFDQLVPLFVDEILPGDSIHGNATIFARLATLIFPLMDNIRLETFFFFVPNRLTWTNWPKFMGERSPDPSSSISYTVPICMSPVGGWPIGSLGDYMGLTTVGQAAAGSSVGLNVLPFRAYNLIWNTWFRDENLVNSIPQNTGDGPDLESDYVVRNRYKRKDYFTSALPWPAKQSDVELPIYQGLANVHGIGPVSGSTPNAGPVNFVTAPGVASFGSYYSTAVQTWGIDAGGSVLANTLPLVYANLASITTGYRATVNALRTAVQTQRFLERDARGGTRYTELLQSHFGVVPEDYRLQRPEYIGGGASEIQTQAIPQTAPASGGSTPLGNLGAASTTAGKHTFTYHAKEHGYILGLVNITGATSYQQGVRRMWYKGTRYDFYWPVFAHLGEQAIKQGEIYATQSIPDVLAVFGYQERWAEYKYIPNRISGPMRSTAAANIDEWHLSQQFGSAPLLNEQFIIQNTPVSRVMAAGLGALNQACIIDSLFHLTYTRPMPMYSTPGLMDHF